MWTTVRRCDSSNKNVSKFTFEKADAVAEAVLYKYPEYEERTVICCSTQSGCPVGCRFCGAGDSFARSLTVGEICAQPDYLLRQTGIEWSGNIKSLQIMFMSMGEPMLNWKEMRNALYHLYYAHPNARLLISTIGPKVPEAFEELRAVSYEISTIGLQFSIHESTNERRDKLIPFKGKMSLEEIALEGCEWHRVTQRKPFINYCATEENSSVEDAHRLWKLFDPKVWEATVSVVCERDESMQAAHERQRTLSEGFQSKLKALGFSTRVFDPAGQDDIGGGCGQLPHYQRWVKENPNKTRPTVGAGLPIVHSPQ